MDIFSVLNGLFYAGLGILVFSHIIKNWNDAKKRPYRYSELIYGAFLIFIGYTWMIFLDHEGLAPSKAYEINRVLFFINLAFFLWIEFFNINFWRMKIKNNPELEKERNDYEGYLNRLREAYEHQGARKDIIKDLSRKFLHIVVLIIVLGMPAIARNPSIHGWIIEQGINESIFVHIVYLVAACLFLMMFTYADYWRLTHFSYLPNWAHKWYFKSLEPKTESYTYISSVPFLLSLLVLIYIPNESILYASAMISCVSDAVASVIGKSFGEHKMKKFGLFPQKSYEGLVAGAFSAYLGVFIIFHYYDPGTSALWDNLLALIGALIFIFVDAYGKLIADNVLNTILPALAFWIILTYIK